MKSELIKTLFVALFPLTAFAQETRQPQNGDAFRTTTPINGTECDFGGGIGGLGGLQSAPAGSSFNIVGSTTNDYIISFWLWGTSASARAGVEAPSSKRARLNINNSTPAIPRNRYFLISKNQFEGNTNRLYKRWTATLGILTYPLKYRPQTGVFEKSFTVSAVGGASILFNRSNPNHSFAFTLGAGASSVNLTPKNTEGLTEAKDEAAATFSINLIYINDRLQIGATCGWDALFSGTDNKWDYNGKHWLAIGIGASIFTPDKPSSGVGKQ